MFHFAETFRIYPFNKKKIIKMDQLKNNYTSAFNLFSFYANE